MPPFPAAGQIQAPPAVIQGCLEACRRCRELVETIVEHEIRAYEGVGPQLRHCLDHFLCLLRGVDSGVVDYDARDRDPRLEQDPHYFLTIMDSVVRQLQSMDPAVLRRSLSLHQEVAPGGQSGQVDTNMERELAFLSSHTIHHIAIMSLLAEARGVEVPPGLGVAFSTATFMQRPAISEAG
jgi:hypothetical protein